MVTKLKNNSTYSRTYEASPLFDFVIPQLTTLASYLIDIELDKPEAKKYLPLTNIQVQNNSSYNIYIYPNQSSRAFSIPAGAIIGFDKSIIPSTRSLKVYNAGTGTISAGEVLITIYKEGVQFDNVVASIHKAIYKTFFNQK